MTKPQFAAEPSMEDILASIRRMISDDKPVSNPLPDQMARTPFDSYASTPAPRATTPGAGPTGQSAPGTNFSSLSDALKAASATTEQRRGLQQEIAEVLEKGPHARGRADLASFEPRPSGAEAGRTESASEPHFPSLSQRAADMSAETSRSFDFGTVVPQPRTKAEPIAEAEPTVVAMPSRGNLGGPTVSPFPRAKEVPKPAPEPIPTKQTAKPDAIEIPARVPVEEPAAAAAASSAASEALLDAVVDMVQKQPESLSVFTSGASFISGVAHKATAAEALASVVSAATNTTSGAPPKMDKAAAELLRPMLRQWLSDNMPRIVEEALRSELMSTQDPGKGSKG